MTTTSPARTPPPVVERRKSASATKPRSFLFVNKDAESEILSRSSGRVATSINSHVQRWQDKREGRIKSQPRPKAPKEESANSKAPAYRDCVAKFRPKPRKKAEKQAVKQESRVKQESPSFGSEHSESSSSAPTTSYSTTPESLGTSPESDGVLDVVNRDGCRPLESAIFSANFSGADCIDPFQSTMAHLPGVQPILQYYISFTKVSTFQSDAKVNGIKKEPLHYPAIIRILEGSMTQKVHMYALLAATAARMKSVSGIVFAYESSPLVLLGNAIHYIREHLGKFTGPLSEDDRQVILDIFYLCVCEWYEKVFDKARYHLAQLLHFWSTLKPSENLFDKYIHDMITYNDVFLAIETGEPPLFALTWEPGPLLPAKRVYDVEVEVISPSTSPGQSPLPAWTLSRSPLAASTPRSYSSNPTSIAYSPKPSTTSLVAIGFALLTTHNNPHLPTSLLEILSDLIPLIRITHSHRLQTLPPPSPTEIQWSSLKTQALLHKLLSLPPAHPAPTPSIILSLIILLSCTSTSPAWRAGKLNMPGLSSRLRSTLSPDRVPLVVDNIHYAPPTIDDSLLLWILVSGAFAAQTDPRSEAWFLGQAVPCAKRMGVVDDGGIRAELSRWLYMEHLEGVTLRRLCTAIRLS